MDLDTAKFRDTRSMPNHFKKKFEGTPLEGKTYIQAAIFRLCVRLEDNKIENRREFLIYLKQDYWGSQNTRIAYEAMTEGHYDPAYGKFQMVDGDLDDVEIPSRGETISNDSQLIGAIIEEVESRDFKSINVGRLRKQIQEFKDCQSEGFPLELTDSWVINRLAQIGFDTLSNNQKSK